MFEILVDRLEPDSARRTAAVAAVLTIAVVLAVDALTPAAVRLSFMILPPLTLLAWCSRRWAVAAAVAAGAASFVIHRHDAAMLVVCWNEVARTLVFVLVAWLAGTLRQVLLREHHLATRDPMTGLLNRRAFLDEASRELERARRELNATSLLFVDLDDLKETNDRHGHHAGDEMLMRVATAARACVRPMDLVGRMGGDEFALLLPHTDKSAAQAVLGRLRQTLSDRAAGPVSVSIGVVTCDLRDETIEELLQSADAAMYEAKRYGRAERRGRRAVGGTV